MNDTAFGRSRRVKIAKSYVESHRLHGFPDFLKQTAKGPLFNTNNKITRITVVQKGWDKTHDMAPKMN